MPLNDFFSASSTTETKLPQWYTDMTQGIANQASAAAANAPTMNQTVANKAINTIGAETNPWEQANSTLQNIAAGAANPWTIGPNGEVTPNTGTAMGGLFAAQNAQLNQLLPTTLAPTQAGSIAGGNFGSLRGQTATQNAKGNAFANTLAQQMQAALQNQATGVSAATGAGNVSAQGVDAAMKVGQAQQDDPFRALKNQMGIISEINLPKSQTTTTQVSPMDQWGTIANMGSDFLGGLPGAINTGKSILDSLFK